MARTVTASEARAGLPEILDTVSRGEEVTITRHGRAVAVVVRPDALRVRRADAALESAATVRELVERSRKNPLDVSPALSEARAEELVTDVRAGRSRH
ncbi:MAG TPA: type II toxin-antitoxin system Phd/YefM family antitoxin [Acidimicrobiales bacterium]|nr:type II toxin-antitoxin system Phd/YefM family antitoxin [Acidimicrobiales bacterium]